MKQPNRVNRPLLTKLPLYPILNQKSLQKAIDNKLLIIDTHSKDEIAKGLFQAVYILKMELSTWFCSLVEYQHPIVLITDNKHTEDLTRKLMRIGMDNIYGFITDLNEMDMTLEKSDVITINEFKKHFEQKDVQVIDVRTESEYKSGHIQDTENIVLTVLENGLEKVSKDKPVSGRFVLCISDIYHKTNVANYLKTWQLTIF